MEHEMDHKEELERNEELEERGYVPRPKWQIIAAWVGLAAFLAFLAMYYAQWFR